MVHSVLGVAALLYALSSTNPNSSSSKTTKTLEVCLSPGCVADGADVTLRRLRALAPPDCCSVLPGGCVSACGKGPVVRERIIGSEQNKKKDVIHRRVSSVETFLSKVLSLDSTKEEEEWTVEPSLLEAYNLACDAEQSWKQRNVEDTMEKYRSSIALFSSTTTDTANEQHLSSTPAHLEWILQAHSGLAEACLQAKDVDGALQSSLQACKLSCYQDGPCLELLAKIYMEQNDVAKELDTLQTYLNLPMFSQEVTALPRDVENRKREMTFRLAKLERES